MSLEHIRMDIARVDDDIIRLLARRMELAELVLKEKKRLGLPINDDRQNALVLKRAMEKATELNVDTAAVREVFSILIRMSIDRQHEMSGEGNL
ncbi:chorismate mutase [Methanocella arvoryzae]|uniref:Chorismate mutase n=1 Tax=Methanocella arvoryzae (strain DSM 22066 / NBRC 105507 / MRE50) TaxID=351160 RepID=Q0W4U1_METAR|nr:chorismate mutase [Methanocella arvoryzae]CAJ36602.1 chorismate mutase [Methanocella arvoryzae MRE50]